MLGEVGGLKVAALSDVQLTHAGVGIVDLFAGDVDDFGAVFEAEGVVVLTADGGEERNFVLDGLHVAVEELDGPSGTLAPSLHAGLAGPEHDDVVADAEEAVENA